MERVEGSADPALRSGGPDHSPAVVIFWAIVLGTLASGVAAVTFVVTILVALITGEPPPPGSVAIIGESNKDVRQLAYILPIVVYLLIVWPLSKRMFSTEQRPVACILAVLCGPLWAALFVVAVMYG